MLTEVDKTIARLGAYITALEHMLKQQGEALKANAAAMEKQDAEMKALKENGKK